MNVDPLLCVVGLDLQRHLPGPDCWLHGGAIGDIHLRLWRRLKIDGCQTNAAEVIGADDCCVGARIRQYVEVTCPLVVGDADSNRRGCLGGGSGYGDHVSYATTLGVAGS